MKDEKAFTYFKQAAEQEFYNEGIGICYEMGIGVEENETEAFQVLHPCRKQWQYNEYVPHRSLPL